MDIKRFVCKGCTGDLSTQNAKWEKKLNSYVVRCEKCGSSYLVSNDGSVQVHKIIKEQVSVKVKNISNQGGTTNVAGGNINQSSPMVEMQNYDYRNTGNRASIKTPDGWILRIPPKGTVRYHGNEYAIPDSGNIEIDSRTTGDGCYEYLFKDGVILTINTTDGSIKIQKDGIDLF